VFTGEGSHIFKFSPDKWKADKMGCNGYRAAVADSLVSHEAQYQGKDTIYIYDEFGSPDFKEKFRDSLFFCTLSIALNFR
jgi:hypothetical protein